jgi:hypothetical protein
MATNGGSTTNRNLPDVAMVGNNVSVIWNNGQTNTYAGTSIAAPLWAAFMASANQQAANYGQPAAGFINPAIYGIGQGTNYHSCFHDITGGNNTRNTSTNQFFAQSGYDLCSGWGTPAGQPLINALAPPTYLVISPAAGLAASGLPGGPFNPSFQSLSLSNHGSTTLSWSLTNIPAWLTANPTNGTLTAGSVATTITVGFTSVAYTLTSGTYSASLAITDGNTLITQFYPFTLEVSPSLIKNGGFEAGNFANWTLAGDSNLTFVSASHVAPHSGRFSAISGQYNSLAYLSQSVPTTPGQAYLLSFWLANPKAGTPNQFIANWIPAQATTNALLNQANFGALNWTNEQFVVVSTGTNSTVQFGFRNDPQYLGLDDVSLTPVPTPLLAITSANGTLVFSWIAFPRLKYQVQCNTNLTSAGWVNIGDAILPSNTVGTASVSIGTDLQRFYRILGPN